MTRKLIALTLCIAFICAVGLTGCAQQEPASAPGSDDAPAENGAAEGAPALMPPPMPTPPAPAAPAEEDNAPAEGSG